MKEERKERGEPSLAFARRKAEVLHVKVGEGGFEI